ncbi:MAG: PH domain-containing protein [Myxococcales bacterium]|nr:MAG: PH domain-containing protein [Myxococcales bacterium]
MNDEKTIWTGGPSQVLNLKVYVVCFLLCFLVIPIFYALWKWLELKNTRYELTNQRLKMHYGILSKHSDDIELYRVKDTRFEQPFVFRLFGVGNIILATSDISNAQVMLRAVHQADSVRDQIRANVEEVRSRKGVREVDFN